MKLSRILTIDEDKCVNCHQCIAVCSTKFANNGSGDSVFINDDLCIGCGECIKACTHNARIPIDDFEQAMESLKKKENIVAIVAPAAASNFPGKYLQLNGWLKSIGVKAVFDVSFGAELTIKSYINHIQKNNPKTVIAQPCPALVTYIEVYRPELLPYLAPADSPMMHTVKMIMEYYPKYKDHKVLVVSPCIAKKREFDDVGLVDFNLTMRSLENYFEQEKIDLASFEKVEFDNDPAERAVLFSTPGGLLSTAERDVSSIRNVTRKIEGPHTVYRYLDLLKEQIDKGRAPLLIDCLNCENGCNGGTGTTMQDTSADELEYLINERRKDMQSRYKSEDNNEESLNKIQDTVSKYWKESLYIRKYQNKHKLFTNNVKTPDKEELQEIYESMHKYSDDDMYNCASCGYNSCEMMAIAIFNGYNKPENCHHFLANENEEKTKDLREKNLQIQKQKNELIEQSESLLEFIGKIRDYAKK
ncbi:MAG: 4Fe-4S binding protein [Bacteroidales bacterium]|nr:4Fe-4S binding protein [Bacteroidales bacterium]MBN2819997.1 4Fe-4S binding protein [Bacteroidales bacterium]